MRRTIPYLVFALCLVALLWEAQVALASPTVKQQFGSAVDLVVRGKLDHADVDIARGHIATLLFPEDFTIFRTIEDPEDLPFGIEKNGHVVSLWVRDTAPKKGPIETDMFFATPKFAVNVTVRLTADPAMSLKAGRFVHRPDEDRVPGDSVDGETSDSVPPSGDSLMTQTIAMGLLAGVRGERKEHDQGQAIGGGRMAASCEVQVDTGAAEVEDQDVVFVAFGVVNRCADSFAMSEVKLRDSVDTISYQSPPSIWKTGGGKVKPRGDVLADIAPGEEVVGMLMVNANAVAPGPLTVKVIGTAALQAPGVAAELYEIVKKKPPFVRTVAFHVQAVGGWIWLANPLDKESLDPTGMWGLGMRVSYHLSELFAFEVDAVGASSGNSEFKGVDYNGQQGDLLRRASLGRVSLGGVLRLSSGRYVPVARLGLGLQGASHTAEMDVGGVRMPGPDVGFEFNLTWSVGAGLDIRLGEHLVVGTVVSGTQLMAGNSRSIESRIHLGYTWKP